MALFENFPYTNIHELNLDWIVKIAKDFLEQYTHIQQLISDGETSLTNLTESGLAELQEKADTLEALLQQWYDTHSSDIAQQLADAIADLNEWYDTHSEDIAQQLTTAIASFNQTADAKAEAVIASIPSDYSALSRSAVKSSNILVDTNNISAHNNANNYEPNTIKMINAPVVNQVSNIPHTGPCTIITTGWYPGPYTSIPYGGEVQIYIPHTEQNVMRVRAYDGNVWSDWNSLTDDWIAELRESAVKSSNVIVRASNASDYSNCNVYPLNTIILVMQEALSSIDNKPYDDTAFTIITTGWYSGTSYASYPYGGVLQIAVPAFNNYKHIKYRIFDGNIWYGWREDTNVFYANYSNFMDVIDNAMTVPNSTVILNPGTYTMFTTDRNETYWKNRRPATRYCGIVLKNNIHLIGDGRVTFVANYAGTDEDIKENFSVFNIAGSATIENINVDCSNICYCVHDDPLIVNSVQGNLTIKNCKMSHTGSDHTFTHGAPICYGAGETRACTREIDGNVFRASANVDTLSIHAQSDSYGYYKIVNNVINGRVRYNPYGTGGTVEMIVSNNQLGQDVYISGNTGLILHKFNNAIG